jgi:disease resistance protein RPM1
MDDQLIDREVPDRVWEICGGLPIAIVTMAGLVASRPLMNHRDWFDLCCCLFPEPLVCRKPEDVMRIINFCYNDLSSDIKTCALFLCIFPKGRKINRKRLIRRWIAEGFVNEKQGLAVEDVAETCFNHLIKRKILQPVDHSGNGRVKSCQVHDMVLEYLISKAVEEDFITVVGSHWSMPPAQSNKVRRLAIHSGHPTRAKQVDSMNLSHVWSLTVFESLDKLHFKSLKTRIVQVLDLQGCRRFKESNLKVDLCEMILLKYLSLRRTDAKQLPQNIHKLKYLETLDVRETKVQELPASVGELKRIKHILGGDKRTRKALKLPRELKGPVKTLRILSGIEIVEGSTFAWDLKYFTVLRKLAIYRIHKSDEIFNDLLYSIQYLSGYSLQSLVIDDESSEFLKTLDSMSSYPTDLSALELSGRLLKLPKWLNMLDQLVKLTLSATALRTDNLKILSSLCSLFSLTFSISEEQDPALAAILQKNKSASGGEIFVPAGGFPRLKLLRIFVPLLPSVTFAKEATPQLERIELRLRKLEGLHGLDELGMLHDVIISVDGHANNETRLALEDLRRGSSKYVLIVNESRD